MPTNAYVPHAQGYVDNEGPKVVSSRFVHDDSHTLERALATGAYEGMNIALAKKPHECAALVKEAVLLGRGGAGFPAGERSAPADRRLHHHLLRAGFKPVLLVRPGRNGSSAGTHRPGIE